MAFESWRPNFGIVVLHGNTKKLEDWPFRELFLFCASVEVKVAEKSRKVVKSSLKNEKQKWTSPQFFSHCHEDRFSAAPDIFFLAVFQNFWGLSSTFWRFPSFRVGVLLLCAGRVCFSAS